MVLVVPLDAEGPNLRRFKRSPLWPVLPSKARLALFRAMLEEIPHLELTYLSVDRWKDPLKAGSLLVKEGDSKWSQRYCFIKVRRKTKVYYDDFFFIYFFFLGPPTFLLFKQTFV